MRYGKSVGDTIQEHKSYMDDLFKKVYTNRKPSLWVRIRLFFSKSYYFGDYNEDVAVWQEWKILNGVMYLMKEERR